MTGLPGSAAWCLTGLVLCAALIRLYDLTQVQQRD